MGEKWRDRHSLEPTNSDVMSMVPEVFSRPGLDLRRESTKLGLVFGGHLRELHQLLCTLKMGPSESADQTKGSTYCLSTTIL